MDLKIVTEISLPDSVGVGRKVAYAERYDGGVKYEHTTPAGDHILITVDVDGFLEVRINGVHLFDCNLTDVDRAMVFTELMDAINDAMEYADLGEAIDWETVFEDFELSDDCYMW